MLLVVLQMLLLPAQANEAEQIAWGEIKQGVYDNLQPYTLLWSGNVLERGGLNLSTMQLTASSKDADIVMNSLNDLGANAILELNQDLAAATAKNMSGFTNAVEMAEGKIYLIVLHDGSLAKIRIDRMLPTKVMFSYVRQAGTNLLPTGPQPQAKQPPQNQAKLPLPTQPGTMNNGVVALLGKWGLWVPGGYAPTQSTTNYDGSRTVYQTYTPGAGGDILTINADGTYKWEDPGRQAIIGKWVKSGNEITLQKGEYGWDWNVKAYTWSDTKGVMIYTLGVYYEGRRVQK